MIWTNLHGALVILKRFLLGPTLNSEMFQQLFSLRTQMLITIHHMQTCPVRQAIKVIIVQQSYNNKIAMVFHSVDLFQDFGCFIYNISFIKAIQNGISPTIMTHHLQCLYVMFLYIFQAIDLQLSRALYHPMFYKKISWHNLVCI